MKTSGRTACFRFWTKSKRSTSPGLIKAGNTNPQDKTFSEQIEELRVFFENRYDSIVPCLAEHFGLTGELVTLTLSVEDGSQLALNTLELDLSSGDWQGQYYTDYPVTLTAPEQEGFEFIRWEIEGGTIVQGNESDSDTRIQAVYDEQ